MERLAREALVSRNASREMLRILGWQQYLDQVPRYVKVNPYARELNMQDLSVASARPDVIVRSRHSGLRDG